MNVVTMLCVVFILKFGENSDRIGRVAICVYLFHAYTHSVSQPVAHTHTHTQAHASIHTYMVEYEPLTVFFRYATKRNATNPPTKNRTGQIERSGKEKCSPFKLDENETTATQ